jgi:hypothetical protein
MLDGLRAFGRAVGTFQARLLLTLFYLTVAVPFAVIAKTGRPFESLGWTQRREASLQLKRARLQF